MIFVYHVLLHFYFTHEMMILEYNFSLLPCVEKITLKGRYIESEFMDTYDASVICGLIRPTDMSELSCLFPFGF